MPRRSVAPATTSGSSTIAPDSVQPRGLVPGPPHAAAPPIVREPALNAALTAAIAAAGSPVQRASLHAGPALARVCPVGNRVTPRLVGRGRGDHVALDVRRRPRPGVDPRHPRRARPPRVARHLLHARRHGPRAPSLVADLVAAGHEAAVHGDEHRSMLSRGPRAARRDIQRATDAVADAAGV